MSGGCVIRPSGAKRAPRPLLGRGAVGGEGAGGGAHEHQEAARLRQLEAQAQRLGEQIAPAGHRRERLHARLIDQGAGGAVLDPHLVLAQLHAGRRADEQQDGFLVAAVLVFGLLLALLGFLGGEGTPLLRQRLGVRALPEEPLRNACVGALSVADNMGLRSFDQAPFARGGWRLGGRLRAQARAWIGEYGVKTQGERAPIRSLSGGNVQRAVLARELAGEPRLLLVSNPVFGLDFAAVADIHARLRAARARGCAVLLVSEDLDELLALADRIVVMSEGSIVHSCDAADADRHVLGACMGGGHHAHAATEAA